MQTTNQTQVLNEVKSLLEKKYSKIEDLEISVKSNSMQFGFNFMNYLNSNDPLGRYPFHEVTFHFDMSEMKSVDDIYNYFNESIQQKLKWVKTTDEEYAEEFNKPLDYTYDSSLIEA